MPYDPMDLKELREHPRRALLIFRLPAVFIMCYVADMFVYMFVFKSAYPTYLQGFLTSPFSPTEDYTGYYHSPQVGAVYNFVMVVFVILFADLYFRWIRPSGNRTSPSTAAFFLSVAASYVLSGVWWASTGREDRESEPNSFAISSSMSPRLNMRVPSATGLSNHKSVLEITIMNFGQSGKGK